MEQPPTSFDDVLVRGLEQQYRKAVAKVFIHDHGDIGWTGFLVNLNPCVIVTVAHPVRSFEQADIYSEDKLYVKFHEDPVQYRAKALKCGFKSDLLILKCERPTAATFFRFADHTSPILSSTSVLCISHPAQRDWTSLRGAICRAPFEIGEHETYDHNMLLFDHDAQCFPGSSGAPIIDLMGRVIGMQFSEIIVKEHGFCVRDDVRQPLLSDYESFNFNVSELPHQVKELPFLLCNVKQAITLQYLAQSLRKLFQDEGVNFDTDLNSYVRRSAMIIVTREARKKNQGKQPTHPPPGKSPREKRLVQVACTGGERVGNILKDQETTEEINTINPGLSFSEGPEETCLGNIEKIPGIEQIEARLDVEVVSFDLDKSIASHELKVETTRIGHEFDRKKFSPMDRALKIQAKLASKFPSFVKNMLPSHVTGFWLGLPENFSDMHLPKHDETVVLVGETELEHETKYLVEKNGLSVGWRGFSVAHKLQEKDVLVFHLIQQCKFKVYIVRANALTEIDGTISLLNLGACVEEMNGDHHEEDLKITVMAREEHWEHYSPIHSVQKKDRVALRNNVDAADNHYGMGIDNYGTDDFEGIRFSQSVDFKEVKSFENFNIIVNGLNIDCKIPQHLRVKYHELCCSEKAYLHNQLTDGLNLQLVVGVISETINIADGIKSSKFITCENLKSWDNTLKSFEILGMKVGFLRASIDKLMTLSSDSEDALKCKILEEVDGTMVKAQGIIM